MVVDTTHLDLKDHTVVLANHEVRSRDLRPYEPQ